MHYALISVFASTSKTARRVGRVVGRAVDRTMRNKIRL